ncbi:MAG: nitrile hydratase subunit alpha [Pseudomonadota bacterium]
MSTTHDHGRDHDHAPISDGDSPVSKHEVLETALRELLIEKGVITAEQVHAQIDTMESRNPGLGAKIVARAWSDPGFRARLIAEPRATIESAFGIDMWKVAELVVLENTDDLHHVVVCTLCSCYPRMVLGPPPAWYKSTAYRARVVRDPRGVLEEFGVDLPAATKLRVVDSTADMRFLVIPVRPDGTDGMDEAALAGLVTRDSMIGTGSAKQPV